MAIIVAMLRGVNLGRRKVNMQELRAMCESLGFANVQTYVQSGNVVFTTKAKDFASVARRMEDAVEQTFGFHSDVVIRTPSDLRSVVARNPFAGRPDIEPRKLQVTFLAREPDAEAREQVLRIKANPEEVHLNGRELYIYFANGMARPKLSMPSVERALKVPSTGRNWNTVTKLLEIAEKLEG